MPMSELASWKCHKVVMAGKIMAVSLSVATITVENADGSLMQYDLTPNLVARGTPTIGDYFVVYEDGYSSWSPKKAFEEGYARWFKEGETGAHISSARKVYGTRDLLVPALRGFEAKNPGTEWDIHIDFVHDDLYVKGWHGAKRRLVVGLIERNEVLDDAYKPVWSAFLEALRDRLLVDGPSFTKDNPLRLKDVIYGRAAASI